MIAAHNYRSHFGRLSALVQGDTVRFTDVDGNLFLYEVVVLEILEPDETEAMIAGVYDLSLFTCTAGGASRFTVRCKRLSPA